MEENLPPSTELSPVTPRLGLIIVLLASMLGVYLAVAWVYHQVHKSLGMEIAGVVVAFLAILVMGLILVGVRVGFSTKHALCRRRDHAERIYHLLKRSRTFQEFWLYLGLEAQRKSQPLSSEQTTPVTQAATVGMTFPIQEAVSVKTVTSVENELSWLMELEGEVTKRGRTPEHPIHRWARVVYAWEHRDLWNEPITLDQFLCREFGEHADGSPKVSRKSFYDWRKKVHQAAREYQVAKRHTQIQGNVIGECKQISDGNSFACNNN
jgi:hypothetical protein